MGPRYSSHPSERTGSPLWTARGAGRGAQQPGATAPSGSGSPRDILVQIRSGPSAGPGYWRAKSNQKRSPEARAAKRGFPALLARCAASHTRHPCLACEGAAIHGGAFRLGLLAAMLGTRYGGKRRTHQHRAASYNPLGAAEHWTEQGQPAGAKAGCRASTRGTGMSRVWSSAAKEARRAAASGRHPGKAFLSPLSLRPKKGARRAGAKPRPLDKAAAGGGTLCRDAQT